MSETQENEALSKATESIKRIQQFEPSSLAREGDLGIHFSFTDAVEPAQRIVSLYNRLALSALEDLPGSLLNSLTKQANQDYSRFNDVLQFDPKQENANQIHDNLITHIKQAYEKAFNALHPFISYSMYKSTDFQRLEGDARATLQSIRDEADKVNTELVDTQEEAERILEEVRKIAAEQGVTQQATYFKTSADSHETSAETWKKHVIGTAVALGIYAAVSLFIHKLPFLAPQSTYDTVQLAISKVLIFGVISYYLYLSIRNYLSHKHNSIVDRHRQNALLTYQALIEAAGDTPNREVILVQAAACIFGPQSTGYAHESSAQQPGIQSVVEFLSKPLKGGDSSAET